MIHTKVWKHRAYRHERVGKYLFQINIPLDGNVQEFEVVAFDNGTVKDRAIYWDGYESHMNAIAMLYSYLVTEPTDERFYA